MAFRLSDVYINLGDQSSTYKAALAKTKTAAKKRGRPSESTGNGKKSNGDALLKQTTK